MAHETVLLNEAAEALALTAGDTVVDATLGSGGHSRALAKAVGPTGHVISLDVDPIAIADAQVWKDSIPAHITLCCVSFTNLAATVAATTDEPVHGVLADLGWRTEQFTEGERGFSFRSDEPLHMTFGDPASYDVTAHTIVNEWDAADVANVLFGYGEERYARKIAAAIDVARQTAPIETARQLADIIVAAVPAAYARRRVHAATKSFQALRIAVNDELAAVDSLITEAVATLAPGGNLAIISFHSLEDRIVKHRFRELVTSKIARLPHRKPILASPEETAANPRARSAKLRTLHLLP